MVAFYMVKLSCMFTSKPITMNNTKSRFRTADIHSVAVLGSSLLEDLAEVEALRDLLLAEPSVNDGK